MGIRRETLYRLILLPVALVLVFVLYRSTFLPGEADRLLDYFLYMCVSCQTIPFPTVPLIVFMGREVGPPTTALLGALGTSLANLIDYAVFGSLLSIPALSQMRRHRTYRRLASLFDSHAFIAQVLGNAIPIPIDPVRFMAISRGYPWPLYLLATFIGRFPRYYALSWVGFGLRLSNQEIILLFAVLTLLAMVRVTPRIVREIRVRRARERGEARDGSSEDSRSTT